MQELAMAGWDAWPLKGVEELENDPRLMGYLKGSVMTVTVSVGLLRCRMGMG